MRPRLLLLFVLLVCPSIAQAADKRPKVAVMRVETGDKEHATSYTEVVTSELSAIGTYEVISASDIEAMLGYQATQQTLDCNESVCLAEIGGALGADKVLSTQLDIIGGAIVVNVKLIDMKTSSIEGRSNRTVDGTTPENGVIALRNSVRGLFGLSETNSVRGPGIVAISSAAVGVVGIGVGVLFGLSAKSHYDKANDPSYVGGMKEVDPGERDKLIANIGFGVGAVGIIGGTLWWWLVDNGNRDSGVITSVNVAALSGGGALVVGGRF